MEYVDVVTADGNTVRINISCFVGESEYFRGLHASGMRELLEKRIELPVVSSLALNILKKYIEENRLCDITEALTMSNLEEIVIASNYLQMDNLLAICAKYLEENITIENCKYYHTVGINLMIRTIQEISDRYMKYNFDEFINTKDFLTLSDQEVQEYLAADDLNPSKEVNVFHAAIAWIKENKNVASSVDLLQCIRFAHLTSEERLECVRTCKEFQLDSKCVALVTKSLSLDAIPNVLPKECAGWFKMRSGNSIEVVLATGGFTKITESSTNRVQFVQLDLLLEELEPQGDKSSTATANKVINFTSTKSTKMPGNLCEHCTCVVDNFLYVAGGQSRYRVNGSHTQSQVWRFDPRTVSWKQMSSMRQPRSLFCMLELARYLYAVCGWKAPETVNKSVERYDPQTDTWQYVAPIAIGLHEHAGCTHGGHIYITGGYKGPLRGHLDLTWRYDPRADMWSPLATMIQARSYHTMVTLETQNKLLVAGGVFTNQPDEFEDIQHCELYDPATNQWTLLPSTIPRPASCMPALTTGSLVCLFGGHSFEDSAKRHSMIQTLNTENWTWSEREMSSNGILFFALSLLRLPRYLCEKST